MCQRETPYEYVCTSICVLEVEIDCVSECAWMWVYVCACVGSCVHVRVCAGSSMCPHQAQEVMMLRGNPRLDGVCVWGVSVPAPRRVSLEEEGIKSVCSYAEAL